MIWNDLNLNKNDTTTQNVSQVAQTHGVATSTSQDNEIHYVNDIGNYIGTTLNQITDRSTQSRTISI